jgi:copper chaperone CopZ
MMIKKKFKIGGMHCTSCAFSIDGDLEDTNGVKESNTNFAKAQTEVKYDDSKISEKQIIEVIKKVGYDAV